MKQVLKKGSMKNYQTTERYVRYFLENSLRQKDVALYAFKPLRYLEPGGILHLYAWEMCSMAATHTCPVLSLYLLQHFLQKNDSLGAKRCYSASLLTLMPCACRRAAARSGSLVCDCGLSDTMATHSERRFFSVKY